MDINDYAGQKIENMGFSTRTYNCLKRNHISLVGDLLGLKEEELLSFRNLGKQSLQEIKDKIASIESMQFDTEQKVEADDKVAGEDVLNLRINGMLIPGNALAYRLCGKSVAQDMSITFHRDGLIVPDVEVLDMSLSVRSRNGLLRSRIKYLSDLLMLPVGTFYDIKNLGEQSKKEILSVIPSYFTVSETLSDKKAKAVEGLLALFPETIYKNERFFLKQAIIKALLHCADQDYVYKIEQQLIPIDERVVETILQGESFDSIFRSKIIGHLQEAGESELKDFAVYFPGALSALLQEQLIKTIEDGKIVYEDGLYYINRPTFREFIETMQDGREKEFLYKKALGETLEGIGESAGLTRERVRQILKKTMRKLPGLYEDRYIVFFQKYALNAEMVQYFFRIDKFSYNYLDMKADQRGDAYYMGILDEENVSPAIKKRVEEYHYRDHVAVGDERIKRDRTQIALHILKEVHGEISTDDLKRKYEDFLIQYDLISDASLAFGDRYFESRITSLKEVLAKHGKRVRYYSITVEDFSALLREINFWDLRNIEISTLFFMDHYPDVLQKYDIRDEYELHNLLKKNLDDEAGVTFSKMPIIIIGNADRNRQVQDLMYRTAPISGEELAVLYKEKYGVQTATVMASFFKCISDYYHKGEYNVDHEALDDYEIGVLRDYLTEDVYEIGTVIDYFTEHLGKGGDGKFNSYNLRKLGYTISEDVLFKASGRSISRVCEKILTNEGIVDLNNRLWLLKNQLFYAEMSKLRNNWEIVEFYPNKYITAEHLHMHGCSRNDIESFCEAACLFARGHYFTLRSLSLHGFHHSLYDLGFDELFYASLLRAYHKTAYQRIAGTFAFVENGLTVFNSYELICDIIFRKGSMDVYDIQEMLKEDYGIELDRHKIISMAREGDLFYSDTMEKIYPDYDHYIEEV